MKKFLPIVLPLLLLSGLLTLLLRDTPSSARSGLKATSSAASSKQMATEPSRALEDDASTDRAPDTSPASNRLFGPDAIASFDSWVEDFLATPKRDRSALVAQGIELARQRRSAFKDLIMSDPALAIASALPMVARQQLPPEITSLLERRVNHVAALRTYVGCPDPDAKTEQPVAQMLKRVAELKDDLTYAARVFGERADTLEWRPGASLNGVALDSEFAVSNTPSRPLEVGEIPNPEKPLVSFCPDEGTASIHALPKETPAVESAIEIAAMCDCHEEAVEAYNESIRMAEGGTGGALEFTGILPATATPSIGVVKVLYMPVTYADQNAIPVTEARAYQTLRDVSDYYAKGSYGKLTLLATVTPPVKLPHNEAWYEQQDTANGGNIDGEGMSHRHARDEVRKMGFDTNDFDTHIMRHTGGPGAYGGLAGGSTVWLRGDGAGLTGHEIGHSFGLPHANFWNTAGTSSIGAGTNNEYGHPYDIMGSSGAFPEGHYNAQGKSRIRWLPDNFIQLVEQSGTYRIHAYDQPSLDPSRVYALNIIKDFQRTYWLESRSRFTTRPWIHRGAMLGWRWPSGGANNIQLIDTTPGSPFNKEDAPISLGRTFSDREAGIHMTTVAASESPHYVDVLVNFGRFEGNQAPTLALVASSDVVPVNGTVTFDATASDLDGDPLAYSWQHFGTTNYKVVESNSNSISRTFTTAGTYVVACTVSDMKGGTATRWKLVTVGSGNNRYTINGRVTELGQGVPNVVVTANGANGVITDSDGYFLIPNLQSNTYTLTPLLYGYSFSEQFSNNVTVGPNFDGALFEASPSPGVTLSASVPNADEGTLAPGQFTLARTGDTAQPLVVNVNTLLGTTTLDADYTISPVYTSGSQGFQTFTIPAGQASLDIAVTPLADSAAEGPETVILQTAPGTGYVVSGAAFATVVLDDDDTTLPKVSVDRLSQTVSESDVATPIARFTRTGPTPSPLTVNYSVGGSATAGSDFAVLSGTIQIPQGSASVDLELTPTNNAASESLETVEISLAVGSGYVADSNASTTETNLIDDDVQIVNVAATDPSASEVDLTQPSAQADTGTFLVTRSGDTTLALTVYYSLSGTLTGGTPALHGLDFEPLPGVLVIPAGQTQASVTVIPRHDGIGEGPENAVFQLGAGPTNYILGENSSAEVTIQDHPADQPIVDVIATRGVIENTTHGNFRISARGAGTGTLTVHYTISGTATAGSDYNIAGLDTGTLTGSTTITLADGEASLNNLEITRINDSLVENLEEIILTITPDPAYQTSAPTASASTWIQDDDQNTVFVDAQVGTTRNAANTFTEGATTSPVRFFVSRTGSTASALNVAYTLGGTATAGSDYSAVSGTLTIPAGSLATSLNLNIIDDTEFEGTETIVFNVTPGAYAVGTGANTIYINDNETSDQKIRFSAAGSTALESVTAVSIPVSLTTAATAPVTIDYTPESGARGTSTVSGNNVRAPYWLRLERTGNVFKAYQSANGTTWSQFGSNRTIFMPPEVLVGLATSSRSDGLVATAEFDNVSISPSPSESLQGRTVGYVNVQGTDSESAGTYTLTGSGRGIGSNNQDECHFLSAPISGDFVITTRVASLTGSGNAREAGLMIRENIDWRQRCVSLVARGNSSLKFRWRSYSVMTTLGASIDHDLEPGSLTFGIGEQTKNITFNVTNDDLSEPDENLVIKLLNPYGAQLIGPDTHIYTIQDDDEGFTSPIIGFSAAASSASESDGTASIAVSLASTPESPASIHYELTGGSAVPGTDHTLVNGTLSFAPGDTVKLIQVPITSDMVIEPNRTILLSLTTPSGCQLGSLNTHTFTILDDDLPVVTVTTTDASASEEGLESGSFTFARTGSTVGPLTIPFTLAGTATAGSDFTDPGSSVVIADDSPSIVLPITPLQDSANEGTELIEIAIAPDSSYTVGLPSTAIMDLLDNDRSTVTIVASDPEASETAGNPGQFTLTRTAPTTGSLTVNLTRSGTASNNTDYSGINLNHTFTAGQATRTININPIDDSTTEGPEQVTLSINSGPYDIGTDSFANVTIADNDSPPTIFIATPSAQGPLIASSNGAIVSATVTDDGAPQPLSILWSQASGPGTATFETPTQQETAVTFDLPGIYVLMITATDGQFTVQEQVSLSVGATLTPATWISQDAQPISSRRGEAFIKDGIFTLSATGNGLTNRTNDRLHLVARQVGGDSSLTVRLNSLVGGSSPFGGILIRKTLERREIRCALGYRNGNLEFRTRSTRTTTDSATTIGGVSLPLWLRLERNATTQIITASYATDNNGAPGTWTSIGSPVNLPLNDLAILALGAYSGSTGNKTTATFDNVTLTPSPVGPALLRDHLGLGSIEQGTYAESAGTYTIGGSGGIDGGGSFYGWQYAGDLVVTAKHVDASSSAGSAKSGIMIRESMDTGGYVHFGRIQTGAFSGYRWRSVAGGSTGGLPTFRDKTRWLRLVRQGNSITAFHAPDSGGSPGTWVQVGQPQTIVMTPNVLVGFAVDNASGVGLNTVTFSDLTIEPLNRAPIIDPGIIAAPAISPLALDATVTDDDFPAPPLVTSQWNRLSGVGSLLFDDPAFVDSIATFDDDGAQQLRLRASDGSAESFADLAFSGYASPTTHWQITNFPSGTEDADAAMLLDPDLDGLVNLIEYALGTNPNEHSPSAVQTGSSDVGPDSFMRLTVTKNPDATNITYTVQATSDLSDPDSWSSEGLVIEEDSAGTLRVRDNQPMTGNMHRFMRVLVQQN